MLAGECRCEPRQPGSSILDLKSFGLGSNVDCPVQKYSWGRGVCLAGVGDPKCGAGNADPGPWCRDPFGTIHK